MRPKSTPKSARLFWARTPRVRSKPHLFIDRYGRWQVVHKPEAAAPGSFRSAFQWIITRNQQERRV